MDRERRFLAEHLCRWLPEFGRKVRSLEPGSFYDHAVSAVNVFVTHDEGLLGSLVQALRQGERAVAS